MQIAIIMPTHKDGVGQTYIVLRVVKCETLADASIQLDEMRRRYPQAKLEIYCKLV